MDKFGIFELLDALSAITAAAAPEQEDTPAPQKTPDESYLPPAYGEEIAPEEGGKRAIDDFLARHERAAKDKR